MFLTPYPASFNHRLETLSWFTPPPPPAAPRLLICNKWYWTTWYQETAAIGLSFLSIIGHTVR